jgi:predicted  nucleic acid-binding Zn-ribbon protein
MSQAFHLFQLQKIDTQLDQIQLRLNQIDAILQSNETLKKAEQNAAGADQALKEAQVSLQRTESAVQAQRLKIEISEASLYSGRIHVTKELQDLQNEILSLKRYQSKLEDEQFQAMVALEDAELLQKKNAQELILAQGDAASQSAGLHGEQSQLIKTQERLHTERLAVTPQINAESLSIYARLREQKHGLAVCQVKEDACAACGTVLRPEERQAARSPTQLIRCGTCGRLLYAG